MSFGRTLALLHWLALALVGLWFGLGQDRLLGHSDLVSILGFAAGLSVVLLLPLALGFAGLWLLLPGRRERIVAGLPTLAVALLLCGFALYAIDAVFAPESGWLALAIGVGGAALSWALALRLPDRATAERSVTRLAGFASLAVWASLLVLFGAGLRGGSPAPEDTRPNVIFVMVDALGQDFLPVYNPEVSLPAFDRIAEQSRVYTRMVTNHPFTNGYYEVLYSGSKRGTPSDPHLWSLLQQADVETRWVAYHNNGVPDTHELPYHGLRSAYLTENFRFIPALLGLDYNLFRYRGYRSRGSPMGERELWLSYLSNLPFPKRNVLTDTLVQEAEALRRGGRPFFLLVHTEKSPGKPKWRWWKPRFAGIPTAHAAGDADLDDYLDAHDNVYLPEHQPEIDAWRRERSEEIVPQAVESLAQVFETYRERGWSEDTILIVTSDHGSMFGRGRYAYHYHVDEEAVRVPLWIAGPGLAGRDDRLFETVDLSETILRSFGVATRLSERAVSLFDEQAEKTHVTSLAKDAEHRREWLLAVYAGGAKYVVDLLGDLQPRRFRVEGFESLPDPAPPGTPLPFDLDAVLDEYGEAQAVRAARAELGLP